MKTVKYTLAGLALLLTSQIHAAGFCGAGLITNINEGWGNNNHFQIAIDYSVQSDAVGGTFQNKWIRYLATLDAERLKGIKAIAYMAFASGKAVRVYTHNSACAEATDIQISVDTTFK